MRKFDWNWRNLDRKTGKIARIAALPLFVAGIGLAEFPAQATYYNPKPYRASINDYEDCAGGLLETGLEADDVAAACGAALYPKALSECVVDIDAETELAATDALSGCRRVRRPHELASCVVGITAISTEGTEPLDVLNYCRRSLLPLRFSNCVVGLASQVTAYSTIETMTSCIAATNRPRQVLPSFIPQGQEIPLQPLPETGITAPVVQPTPATTPAPTTPATPTTPSRSVPALW